VTGGIIGLIVYVVITLYGVAKFTDRRVSTFTNKETANFEQISMDNFLLMGIISKKGKSVKVPPSIGQWIILGKEQAPHQSCTL